MISTIQKERKGYTYPENCADCKIYVTKYAKWLFIRLVDRIHISFSTQVQENIRNYCDNIFLQEVKSHLNGRHTIDGQKINAEKLIGDADALKIQRKITLCEENRLIISELQKRCNILDYKFGVRKEIEERYTDTDERVVIS